METTETNLMRPKSLLEAIRYFSDLNVAHEFFVGMRWPQGVCCPRCGSTAVRYMPKYRRFQCSSDHDGRQFTVKTGTVMEDSALGLDKWSAALWLEVNAKNSISSYELHRALGITQKSAWFMLHRIRFALHTGSFDAKLSGVVEADETFVGGLAKNMHAKRRKQVIVGRGTGTKTAVMGLLERHSENKHSTVRAQVVKNLRKKTLQGIVRKNVEFGSAVYTDAWPAYRSLGHKFAHDFVDHAEAYVKDKVVHTNGLENFWSLFKRCVKGTHVSIEPFHIQAYVDSEAFRFNNREVKDGDRFVLAAQGLHGKRLTYKALTGALEATPGNDKAVESVGVSN